MTREQAWDDLSPEEKREDRFARWLSPPDVTFPSQEVEALYRERVGRLIKAIKLKEPDRVPVILPAGVSPVYYAESTLKTVMYDYEEMRRAWIEFLDEFDQLDALPSPGLIPPGRALEIIGSRLIRWPGHGLGDGVRSLQFVESERMSADEYDAFTKEPGDFLMRSFLPRTAAAFGGFGKLRSCTFPMTQSFPFSFVAQYGDPDVSASYEALLSAGREVAKWQAVINDINQAALMRGIPSFRGGMTAVPFDLIGDALRGTKGIMTDMYRRPEKLLKAMERVTPLLIEDGINGANASGCPIVFLGLHKGTGGFMSQQQFETFYWPTLKQVILGLVDEGCVPLVFAEGDFTVRLETICDVPRASVIWYFEKMDMGLAKRVVSRTACIMGNVPVSLLCTGSPGEVKEACGKLIETCASGGGYILAGAADVGEANMENLRAMAESVMEYGAYRR